MKALRRRLIVFAAALLAGQVAVMAAAPVVLYQTKAAAGSELLCDCKVEPGAECPMHGGKAHEAAGKKKTARFSPVCGDQTAAILTLLASGSGIVAPALHVVRPATVPVAVVVAADSVLDSARPPTSPPPRS